MLKSSADNEKKWIHGLRDGDAEAFDCLFELYGKNLYYFSFGYLKSKQEAEEVTQDVFLKIWDNRRNIKPELSFKAYIFKIAYRLIKDKLQKLCRVRALQNHILETSVEQAKTFNEETNYQSLLDLVDTLIKRLPPRQREIYTLRKFEGLSIKEIGEKLSLSSKTIEHHLTKANNFIKLNIRKEKVYALLLMSIV